MASSFLHRKERIILTAVEIIDQLGIQGLSTKEIAKRQGISEGTLFRHFNTKNDIILAVLEHFSKFDDDIVATIRQKKMRATEAILFFVGTCTTYNENYPAITAINEIRGVLAHEPVLAEKFQSILSGRSEFLRSVIKEGQAAGEIRPDIDGEILVNIIDGLFGTITYRWRMENYAFSLREKMLASVSLVLNTFSVGSEAGK